MLGPMWLSFLLGCTIGAYLGSHIGVLALLVPAGFTFSVGLIYMFLRQWFKQFFIRMMKERLSHDLVDAEQSLSRTQGYLSDLRKGNPQATAEDGHGPASHENPVMDLFCLEAEVEHILDTIHQVEEDIEDLQSQQASPCLRSKSGLSESAASNGLQKVQHV